MDSGCTDSGFTGNAEELARKLTASTALGIASTLSELMELQQAYAPGPVVELLASDPMQAAASADLHPWLRRHLASRGPAYALLVADETQAVDLADELCDADPKRGFSNAIPELAAAVHVCPDVLPLEWWQRRCDDETATTVVSSVASSIAVPKLAAELAGSAFPAVRRAAAANVALPPSMFEHLATDPDPEVRRALVQGHSFHGNPAVSAELRRFVFEQDEPLSFWQAQGLSQVDGELLWERVGAVDAVKSTTEWRKFGAGLGGQDFRLQIPFANWPGESGFVADLVGVAVAFIAAGELPDGVGDISKVAFRKDLTEEQMTRLYDAGARWPIAANPELPSALQRRIIEAPQDRSDIVVAASCRLEQDVFDRLLDDPRVLMRTALTCNLTLAGDQVQRVIERCLIKSGDPDSIETGLVDPLARLEMRMAVAAHPNASIEVRDRLALDPIPGVAMRALGPRWIQDHLERPNWSRFQSVVQPLVEKL